MTARALQLVAALSSTLAFACSDGPAPGEPTREHPSALKAAGDTCNQGNECDSGFCVDKVCCTTACTGACLACALALKQSLSENGICGAALEGLDPHSSCTTDAGATDCDKTGACDGKGGCALTPQGAACTTDAGTGNTCVLQSAKGAICSGGGTCYFENSPAGIPCAPYACKGGSCAFPCAGDGDCQPPNRCEAGVCKPRRKNGAPCSDKAVCDSGNCTDGVCCDSNCSGTCQACNLPNKVGSCAFVLGAPVAPRPDCAGTGACKGTCSGNGDSCSYPNNATSCTPAACTGDVSTASSTCDGTGACAAGGTTPCTPYGCDATTGLCKQACSTDPDCAQGGSCDTSTGKCAVANAVCKDATTVRLPNGQTQSCSPYLCLGGKCQQQCTASSGCAPDYACQGSSCVMITDAATGGGGGTGGGAGASTGSTSSGGKAGGAGESGDAGGCGCRMPPASDRGLGALVALAFGIWARRRRKTTDRDERLVSSN